MIIINSIIIKPGEGSISGINMPLIPFNCIFDTDYGLLKLIYNDYLDPSVFDIEWFKKHNKIRELVSSLYNRDFPNPLSLCVLDRENKDKFIDDLYKSFFQEKYNEILSSSLRTEIFNLLLLFDISKDVKATIIYSNSLELEYMNCIKELNPFNKISFTELAENINIYQQFYFKSIVNDIYIDILADSIKVKNIYLTNYSFNNEGHFIAVSEPLKTLIANKNFIRLIDIYNKSKLEDKYE